MPRSALTFQPQTAEDWEAYRQPITELYELSPLKDVMRIMEDSYFFKATVKQYKTRISHWGLDSKRTSKAEYVAILRKKRQREEEAPERDTVFTLHGKPVQPTKIERFVKRHRTELESLLCPLDEERDGGGVCGLAGDGYTAGNKTPPYLGYRTPSPMFLPPAEPQQDNDSRELQRYRSPSPMQLQSRPQSPLSISFLQPPSALLPLPGPEVLQAFSGDSPLTAASPTLTDFDWWDAFVLYRTRSSSPIGTIAETSCHRSIRYARLEVQVSSIAPGFDLGMALAFLEGRPWSSDAQAPAGDCEQIGEMSTYEARSLLQKLQADCEHHLADKTWWKGDNRQQCLKSVRSCSRSAQEEAIQSLLPTLMRSGLLWQHDSGQSTRCQQATTAMPDKMKVLTLLCRVLIVASFLWDMGSRDIASDASLVAIDIFFQQINWQSPRRSRDFIIATRDIIRTSPFTYVWCNLAWRWLLNTHRMPLRIDGLGRSYLTDLPVHCLIRLHSLRLGATEESERSRPCFSCGIRHLE